MTATIAVLGGDEREHHIASSLADVGHHVRVFAGSGSDRGVRYERVHSAREAVEGAQWIICPYPGLGNAGEIYAPAAPAPVRLERALLAASAAHSGGLVLGRASLAVREVSEDLGIALHEAKADSALAVRAATAVAEGLMPLLIERSERLLRDHLYVVVGFGSTGFAITQMLLALRCEVIVAARSKRDRERVRQLGARPVEYHARVDVMETADIVINTVPDVGAVPFGVGASRTTAKILDIASPPGGMDHQSLLGQGLDVSWVRGLGGLRAPLSMAEAQTAFIDGVIGRSGSDKPAGADLGSNDPERTTA